MNRKMNVAAVGLILQLSIGAAVFAQTSGAPPAHLGDNAALDYWRAIYFMEGWSDSQRDIVDKFDAPQIDEVAANALLNSETVHLLHEGAEQPWCDWGIRMEQDGMTAPLPYLNCSRRMVETLLLEARLKLQKGDGPAAAHDWICALSVGRHTGYGGVLVGLLVNYGDESIVIENAALDLNQLDKATLTKLAADMGKLPAAGDLSKTVLVSLQFRQHWRIRKLRENLNQNPRDALASLFFGDPDKSELARGNAAMAASGGTVEGLARRFEALDPLYAQIVETVALPYNEFQEKWPEIQQKLDADPVARFDVLASLNRAVHSAAAVQAHLAMFVAAIDIQANGIVALANHPDPFGTGPFAYNETEHGFELSSKLTDYNKRNPIMLKIGRDAAK